LHRADDRWVGLPCVVPSAARDLHRCAGPAGQHPGPAQAIV